MSQPQRGQRGRSSEGAETWPPHGIEGAPNKPVCRPQLVAAGLGALQKRKVTLEEPGAPRSKSATDLTVHVSGEHEVLLLGEKPGELAICSANRSRLHVVDVSRDEAPSLLVRGVEMVVAVHEGFETVGSSEALEATALLKVPNGVIVVVPARARHARADARNHVVRPLKKLGCARNGSLVLTPACIGASLLNPKMLGIEPHEATHRAPSARATRASPRSPHAEATRSDERDGRMGSSLLSTT